MSQYDFGTIDPDAVGGTELADMLNQWRDAVHSGHRGGTRPGYVFAGMVWVDDGATPWLIKRYDGAVDIVEAEYDPSADTVSFRFRTPSIVKTTAYTVTADDFARIVKVDATSAPITITLPAISAAKDGFPVIVVKTDASANDVTVVRAGSDTIGGAGATSLVLSAQDQLIDLRADAANANWVKLTTIGNFVPAGGGTMTGDLQITKTSARLALATDGGNYTHARRSSDGALFVIDHVVATGDTAINVNPRTTAGAGGAYVRLFRDTDTSGAKVVEVKKGDGTSGNAATAAVNSAGDGLDWTGVQAFGGRVTSVGTYLLPLVVGTTRIWTHAGLLRIKDGSDPGSATDGDVLGDNSGGRLVDTKIFTSSGTWTRPAGLTAVAVVVLGAGGGGGGAAGATSNTAVGGGGGGGGVSEKLILAASLAGTETVTIGAAGSGGSGGGGNGGAGGTSSFGAHCSATGGSGGQGMSAGTAVNQSTPGSGGAGASGDLNVDGDSGLRGFRLSGTQAVSTAGGSSRYGAGGDQVSANNSGNAGVGYGAGGGGGFSDRNNNRGGAAGTDGLVIVHEYG
jgi:hypothetical protein